MKESLKEEIIQTLEITEEFILEHPRPSQMEIAEYCILFKSYLEAIEKAQKENFSVADIASAVMEQKNRAQYSNEESKLIAMFVETHLEKIKTFLTDKQ